MKREGLIELLRRRWQTQTVLCAPDNVRPLTYIHREPIIDWAELGWVDD